MLEEWEIEDMIRDVVQEIAENKVAKFYPSFITKATHLPLDTVYLFLLRMAKSKRLVLKWEIRCDDCFRNIDTVSVPDEYLDQETFCKYCGNEMHITKEQIFPVFEISHNFKMKAAKNVEPLKKKRSLLQLI